MLKKIVFLSFTILALCGNAHAGTCTADTNNCSPGEWCEITTNNDNTKSYACAACENLPSGDAQYITGPGTDATHCPWQMTCPNKSDFANGTWAPDSATITYNGTGTVPACTYDLKKITCYNDGGDCNLGFHPNGDNCVSNVRTCDNNGLQFHIGNTDFTICYVSSSSCGSNETLIGRGYACNDATYGECMTNAIPCNTAPGLTASACSGGTITGNATLNGGTYNLSQCACEKTSVPITNGNAGEKCFYNASTNRFEVNCTNSVNSCDAGYCSTNGQSCVAVSQNYFSGAGDKDCHACPAGAKSAAGSTSISACHYDTSTTFTDSMGSFTIPASNITIEWKK